jgi:hypothetical protein
MQWDLGLQGLLVLAAMSVVFGLFAQVVFWGRPPWWVGLAAGLASFVGGLLISEAWFGWATAVELQPNIDGLSFDEVLLGFLVGAVVVVAARYLARATPHQAAR